MSCTVYNHDKPLNNGTMEIVRYIVGKADKDLSTLSLQELEKMLEQAKQDEKQAYEKLQSEADQWSEHGGKVKELEATINYLSLKPIDHTSNKIVDTDSSVKISNAVYNMLFQWHKKDKWNSKEQVYEFIEYRLTWYLFIGCNHKNHELIASQREKVFKTMEDMKKYIYGRIKYYSSNFEEIYPIIPKQYENLFTVEGLLLPNYKVKEE